MEIKVSKKLGTNKMTEVIVYLLKSLPVQKDLRHIIWLDNLFTSIKLLFLLRGLDFRAAGTARPNRVYVYLFKALRKIEQIRSHEKLSTVAYSAILLLMLLLRRTSSRKMSYNLLEKTTTWCTLWLLFMIDHNTPLEIANVPLKHYSL